VLVTQNGRAAVYSETVKKPVTLILALIVLLVWGTWSFAYHRGFARGYSLGSRNRTSSSQNPSTTVRTRDLLLIHGLDLDQQVERLKSSGRGRVIRVRTNYEVNAVPLSYAP
jgi:hypothetical protein